MESLQINSDYITLEQYEAFPDDHRIEVIDGIAYNMSSPSQEHQTLSMGLSATIYNYLTRKKGPCQVFSAPFDVKLSDQPLTIVQPDIMVICDKNKLDGKRCNGAPDWVIEITSPSTSRHDFSRKLNLYTNAGVREYWIVDPDKKRVHVFDMDQQEFNVMVYTFRDTVKVNIYDDFSIDFNSFV